MTVHTGISRRRFLQGAGAYAAVTALGSGSSLALTKSPPIGKLRIATHGKVFTPGQAGYSAAAHVYNERFDGLKPIAVSRPDAGSGAQAVVRWAVSNGVQLRARSGGHSYAGYSTLNTGVVLDLRNLRHVNVNRGAGTATVGAGTQLIDLYTALAGKGATVPGGSCPSVGVSGVTLGGGMGLAGRAYGLTTDHIVGAQIVTADGRLRQVSAKSDPDLLWALKGGGGGNFGVVTQFTFKLQRLPSGATYFFLNWPWSSAAEALYTWMRWAPHTVDAITSIFHLSVSPGSLTASVSGQFLGPESSLRSHLGSMLNVRGTSLSSGSERYLPLQMLWAGCATISERACHTVGAAPGGTLPRAYFYAKSDYVKNAISEQGANALTAAVASRGNAGGSGAVLFDSYGGAINSVAPDKTAFVHRDQLCAIQYLSYGGDENWLNHVYGTMRSHVSGQAYQNYIDKDLSTWRQAYYAGNYKRLVSIQREYDPHHFFNFPQAIGR